MLFCRKMVVLPLIVTNCSTRQISKRMSCGVLRKKQIRRVKYCDHPTIHKPAINQSSCVVHEFDSQNRKRGGHEKSLVFISSLYLRQCSQIFSRPGGLLLSEYSPTHRFERQLLGQIRVLDSSGQDGLVCVTSYDNQVRFGECLRGCGSGFIVFKSLIFFSVRTKF